MEVYEEVRKQKKLRVVGIQEIVAGIIETLKHDATPFLALAPLRSMDEYTFTHSVNVCVLNLSQAMGLQVDGTAAPRHRHSGITSRHRQTFHPDRDH